MSRGQQVTVLGAGEHARVVLGTLRRLGFSVIAIFDDDVQHQQTSCGVPILGPIERALEYPDHPFVIVVGSSRLRRQLAESFDLQWLTLLDSLAWIVPSVDCGHDTVILPGAVVQAGTHIGRHVFINTVASVDHDRQLGDYCHIAPGTRLAGGASGGRESLIGISSVAMPGLSVGDQTPASAGATAVCDLGVLAKPRNDVRRTETIWPVQTDKSRIHLSPPHMSSRERKLLTEAFDSNWIAPVGPHIDALEEEIAEVLDVSHAVALSSGTAALHLSMLLLGVGPDDEVMTSSLTFAATANAITYVGAKPVFIDSDIQTWNLDPNRLAEAIAERAASGKLPKAVVTVDLYGQCADYREILKICHSYNVPVVEDAAEALGASLDGAAAGTFGKIGCFSLNGNKIITASGGGIMVSDSQELCEKARFLATQARDPAPHYQHSQIGYNYRMSNLLAAVARGQLSVLKDRVVSRRANFEFYRSALDGLPGLSFMPEPPGFRSTRWLTCVTIDPAQSGTTREDVRLALEEEKIESRPVWKPLHLQPVFAGYESRGGTVAESLFRNGLCLPSGSNLNSYDRTRVVDTIRGLFTTRGAIRAKRAA